MLQGPVPRAGALLSSSADAGDISGARKRKLEGGAEQLAADDFELPELGKVSTPPIGGRDMDLEDASDGAFGEQPAPVLDMDAEEGDGEAQELLLFDDGGDPEAEEPASEESEGLTPAASPDDDAGPRIQMIAPRPSGPAGAAGQQGAVGGRGAGQRRAVAGGARAGPLSTLSRLTQAGVLALGENLRYEAEGMGEVISGV